LEGGTRPMRVTSWRDKVDAGQVGGRDKADAGQVEKRRDKVAERI